MNNNFIQGFRISWDNVSKDSYVRNIKAINKVDEFLFENPITFFVGENGSGKSTILEAIAENYGFNKEGGTKNYRFSTFDEDSNLADALVLYKGFRKPDYNYFLEQRRSSMLLAKNLNILNMEM